MKERGILFSAPMVCALLAGTKTQTRRAVKDGFEFDYEDGWPMAPDEDGVWRNVRCPYGQAGDRLWVRETWQVPALCEIQYRATDTARIGQWNPEIGPWRPSIFMPRWASRISLQITSVRVERLQDVSNQDALAEGVQRDGEYLDMPRMAYKALWESINGVGSWDRNQWVWVVSFDRVPSTSGSEQAHG